jgi:pyruvate formate lyase activating enzyme
MYIDFKPAWLYSVEMTDGYIFDIKKFSINDGPGLRTTVFFQGCPLSCPWCHNPEGRSTKPVLMYRANRCALCGECVKVCNRNAIHINGRVITDRELCDTCGRCVTACYSDARELSGYRVSVDEIMTQIERDRPFYEQSGGGVTFSGGEPLLQPRFLKKLLLACREAGISTAVDTSGYCTWNDLESILNLTDLFLYDLKLMDDTRHRAIVGVSNRVILDNLKKLNRAGCSLYIRFPLIPSINDDEDNLRQMAAFLSDLEGIKGVELMGYHEIGLAKYEALDLNYTLKNIHPPSKEQTQEAASSLSYLGLQVKVS